MQKDEHAARAAVVKGGPQVIDIRIEVEKNTDEEKKEKRGEKAQEVACDRSIV